MFCISPFNGFHMPGHTQAHFHWNIHWERSEGGRGKITFVCLHSWKLWFWMGHFYLSKKGKLGVAFFFYVKWLFLYPHSQSFLKLKLQGKFSVHNGAERLVFGLVLWNAEFGVSNTLWILNLPLTIHVINGSLLPSSHICKFEGKSRYPLASTKVKQTMWGNCLF